MPPKTSNSKANSATNSSPVASSKPGSKPGSPANSPSSSPVAASPAMSTNSATSSRRDGLQSVQEKLSFRFDHALQHTKTSVSGDLIPPSTKSQVIRALKFSVLYYYLMNSVIFIYATLIPTFAVAPGFGGLDIVDFRMTAPVGVLMAICLGLPMLRFLVMSWDTEFYQFVVLLFSLELVLLVFVVIFWSPGAPVLGVFFFSNILNIGVSQAYWKHQFGATVKDMKALVPSPPPKTTDTTDFTVRLFDMSSLKEELRRLWGYRNRSNTVLYGERCGVFDTVDQMPHAEALSKAYQKSMGEDVEVPWQSNEVAVYQLNGCIGKLWFVGGWLTIFMTNMALSFSGLWLGNVMFVKFGHQGPIALGCAVGMLVVGVMSVKWTRFFLQEAVGVPVAEKEWLAWEVVRHQGNREELTLDSMGMVASDSTPRGDEEALLTGRMNFVFMWMCAAAVADYIGESSIAKLYWNCANETKAMMEHLVPFDFRLYFHAKWEVQQQGILIQCAQNFVLMCAATSYFGTAYLDSRDLPICFMGLLGLCSCLTTLFKANEACQYYFTVLSQGNTGRHKWISLWMVIVLFTVVFTNVVIWLYFLPTMKVWTLPVGGCHSSFNKFFFAAKCRMPSVPVA